MYSVIQIHEIGLELLEFIHSQFVNLAVECRNTKKINCKLIIAAHYLSSHFVNSNKPNSGKSTFISKIWERFFTKFNVFLQFCHGVRFFIFWSIFNFPCHSSTATAVFYFSQGGAKFLCCRRRQKALRFETWRLSFRRPK